MTAGYRCDHCGEFVESDPDAAPLQVHRTKQMFGQLEKGKTLHVGPCCAGSVEAFICGDHRLAGAKPSTVPDAAERDENGEAVFESLPEDIDADEGVRIEEEQ